MTQPPTENTFPAFPTTDQSDSSPVGVIVCERDGRWAAFLRRELQGGEVRVYETRSLRQCQAMLADVPAALVVLEVTPSNVDDSIKCLVLGEQDFPDARFVVVADRSLHRLEPVVREAGAVHFAVSPRATGELGDLVRRHVESIPSVQQTVQERVWSRLPWKR